MGLIEELNKGIDEVHHNNLTPIIIVGLFVMEDLKKEMERSMQRRIHGRVLKYKGYDVVVNQVFPDKFCVVSKEQV